jgi:hypothetical protein
MLRKSFLGGHPGGKDLTVREKDKTLSAGNNGLLKGDRTTLPWPYGIKLY